MIVGNDGAVPDSTYLDRSPLKGWRSWMPGWLRDLVWIHAIGEYDAFLSYTWRADSAIAPAIQSVIQKFLCPWYRGRRKNVFRDLSSLPAGSSLETELFARLDRSLHFIVLACPAASSSRGMEMEARHWFSRERTGQVLLILTDGDASTWSKVRETCLPPTLKERLGDEPLWIALQPRRREILTEGLSSRLREALTEDL